LTFNPAARENGYDFKAAWVVPEWGQITVGQWTNLLLFTHPSLLYSPRPEAAQAAKKRLGTTQCVYRFNVVDRNGKSLRMSATLGTKSFYKWTWFECFIKSPFLRVCAKLKNRRLRHK
jgi:hypothetical protein